MDTIDLRPLAPIIILELLLKVVALRDLARRNADQVRGPRWLWALLILFVSMLGWVAYLVWGRNDNAS